MSLLIYSNGIVEEYLAQGNTFTEHELVELFNQYPRIQSFRLPEVPNAWCLWGVIDDPPQQEYNPLATEMTGTKTFSHLLIIHDSELNPNWNTTDNIIYKSYSEFLQELGEFINEMTQQIAEESQREMEESEQSSSMIFLTTMGHTKDKRVLFSFNPNEQNDNFYLDGAWEKFAVKIYEYLQENFDKEPVEENKPFVIYSDTKTIVIIEDKHVDQVISTMLSTFEARENYEGCKFITETKAKWYKRMTLPGKPNVEIRDSSTGPDLNLDDI